MYKDLEIVSLLCCLLQIGLTFAIQVGTGVSFAGESEWSWEI